MAYRYRPWNAKDEDDLYCIIKKLTRDKDPERYDRWKSLFDEECRINGRGPEQHYRNAKERVIRNDQKAMDEGWFFRVPDGERYIMPYVIHTVWRFIYSLKACLILEPQ